MSNNDRPPTIQEGYKQSSASGKDSMVEHLYLYRRRCRKESWWTDKIVTCLLGKLGSRDFPMFSCTFTQGRSQSRLAS